ncbi:hypothetical protein L1987_85590 [Smallanthus sonchifolius]|uniref:Uncharacterized protein n=1 Tax=Smallanthus sonchifolius TaxID=185202 RepID=A0ACB8XYJ4_9ASTR|nr:hypothetical protein L1987_85590 [Smallanthus sonchifolius]
MGTNNQWLSSLTTSTTPPTKSVFFFHEIWPKDIMLVDDYLRGDETGTAAVTIFDKIARQLLQKEATDLIMKEQYIDPQHKELMKAQSQKESYLKQQVKASAIPKNSDTQTRFCHKKTQKTAEILLALPPTVMHSIYFV